MESHSRKRAHSLDLHDIASAIQNLPSDGTAVLPSPLPLIHPASSVQQPLAKKTKQEETAADVAFRRALALAVNTAAQRVDQDQSTGQQYYGTSAEETAALVRRLDGDRTARQTRTVDVLDAEGRVTVDGDVVQILAQSLNSQASNSSSSSSSSSSTPPAFPAYVASHDERTVWLWTKYYKGVWGGSDQQVPLLLEGHKGQKGQQGQGQQSQQVQKVQQVRPAVRPASVAFDLISSLASCPELMLHTCTFMRLRDILVLYRVSRVFKRTIDSNLSAHVLFLARKLVAPDTLAIFPWRLYQSATQAVAPTVTVTVTAPDQTTTVTTTATATANATSSTPEIDNNAREPTLRYLGLLVSRERKVRDILACLARAGHRLPHSASSTLKKIWLLMDVSTNRGRLALVRTQTLFTDSDLLNMVLFHVKLVLHFHEPLYGPNHRRPGTANNDQQQNVAHAANNLWARIANQPSHPLVECLLGQRGGLHVLWAMLRNKQFRSAREVIELKVRYDYLPTTDGLWAVDAVGVPLSQAPNVGDFAPPNTNVTNGTPIHALHDAVHAVPLWEMGVGHLEAWGLGSQHLLRPDELAPLEAERRRRRDPENHLDLRRHIPLMAVWGCRDFTTGENLVPTIEEMYMSDDEEEEVGEEEDGKAKITTDLRFDALNVREAPTAEQRLNRRCGNVPFNRREWQPWQVLKKQWDKLPLQDRLDIWWISHQQRLKLQAWGKDALEMHEAEQAREQAQLEAANQGLNQGTNLENGQATHQVTATAHADGDDEPVPYEYDVCKGAFWLPDEDEANSNSNANNSNQVGPAGFAGFGGINNNTHGLSVALSSAAFSSVAPVASSMAPSTAFTAYRNAPGADTMTPTVTPTAATYAEASAYAALAPHDQQLVEASVRAAMRAHDAIDAALVAQADEVYDEYDLELWEQTLAAAGNDLFAGIETGATGDVVNTVAGEDPDQADDDDSNADAASSDMDSDASIDTAAAAPRNPPLTPHTVLEPAYGGDDDALQLLQRLQRAEAGLAAAEAWLARETEAAAAAAQAQGQAVPTEANPTPGMLEAIRERTRRRDESGWLQKKLERQMREEVFAMAY